MSDRSWQRWGSLAGAIFVALMVIAFIVSGSTPSPDDPNAKITAYLAGHSHQVRNIVAFLVFLASVLFLMTFFAALRSRLVEAEGGRSRLASLAFGAGVASTVLLVAAISIFVSTLIMANDLGAARVSPGLYSFSQELGYELWVASVVVGALVVWATSAVVLQTRLLPRWFGWFGVVVGIICLFAVLFIPIFVYWLWILIASVLLTMRPGVPAVVAGDVRAL